MSNTGQSVSCTNCRERGLKCVSVFPAPFSLSSPRSPPCRDEFAEVKAVKLLRRGRRLQQAECVVLPSCGWAEED